jgi:hypothetical protein
VRDGLHYALGFNGYWAALKARGYSIKVYQNSYATYCPSAMIDACSTAGDYPALANSALSTRDKTTVLLRSFVSLSEVLRYLAIRYDSVAARNPELAAVVPPLRWHYSNVPPALGAMAVLERLIADVARAEPGQAYFAHVLMPHNPHVFDASCRLRPQAEWTNRRSAFQLRGHLYQTYADQWRCALNRVSELVRALETTRPRHDFVVIVHGDHGSRIMPVDPDATNGERLPHETFRDAYSTLVAIRLPGQGAGYDLEPVTVNEVVKNVVANDFRGPVAPHREKPPAVVLVNPTGWKPERQLVVPWLFD